MAKAETAFRTIGEVAEALDVPQHVLRFWETRFPQISPRKGGGGRRYYRPDDVALLTAIRKLLHIEGYTIKGVQRLLRSQGVQALRLGATPAAGDANRTPPDAPERDGGEETSGARHAEPLEAQLMALADTLDACARTLAEARARATAPL